MAVIDPGMNELSETQKAYLAGMMDGEGCIFISRNKVYFQIRVIVAGTSEEHIRACADMAGCGSVHMQVKDGQERANQWQWHISSNDALGLLKAILPYLILKADQAGLAIEFQEHITNGPSYNNRHPMPQSVINYRQRMADTLKGMKRNGKVYDAARQELEMALPGRWLQLEIC